MTDYRLIGSRSSKILQRKEKCDHDYVGLESSLYKIIEKFGTLTFCKKTIYPFLKENYEDALKDIKQWKHLDSSFGLEYLEKIKKVEGIFKYELKTKDDLIEYEIVNPLLSNSLILECKEEDDNLLEAIKTSHIIFPRNFLKHIKDLHDIRKVLKFEKRCKELENLMIMRRIEHYLMFGVPGRNINLEKSNEDFLENEVTLYVDKFMKHDDIHMLVKLDKMPAYYDLRHDKTKAKIDYDLFLKASEEQKINCVKEEAMVLALERYLLPQRDKDQKVALLRAMNRMGTTLTKGWFREYVIDNFYQALDKIDTDLIKIKDVIYKSNKKEEKKQVEEKKEEVGENIKDLNEDEKIMYQRILKNSTIENGIMDFEDEKYHIRIGQHFQNGFEDGGWCNRYNYWIGSLYIMNMDERMYYEEDFNPSRINVDYGGVCYKECNQNGLYIPIEFETSISEDNSFSSPFKLNLHCNKIKFLTEEDISRGLTEKVIMKAATKLLGDMKLDHLCESEIGERNIYRLWKSCKE